METIFSLRLSNARQGFYISEPALFYLSTGADLVSPVFYTPPHEALNEEALPRLRSMYRYLVIEGHNFNGLNPHIESVVRY